MTPHLSTDQTEQLQQLLLQRRAELQRAQAEHRGGASRAEHAREVLLQDSDDARQRDADREVDLAISDREVVALADIDAALQRLAQGPLGRYGLCTDCGEPVAAARLLQLPTALRCLACASALERGHPPPARL